MRGNVAPMFGHSYGAAPLAAFSLLFFVSIARAQTHTPPTKRKPAADAGASTVHATSGASAASGRDLRTTTPSPDGGFVETKTLDGGARAFKFSELDIEGRIKGPQLVYFLRRVRAEFAAEELGHRSFFGEMSQTRNEPSF